MTVQLCAGGTWRRRDAYQPPPAHSGAVALALLCGAGNVPDFLQSLTLSAITQARGSIDYAWFTGDATNNGEHNFAAADNGWVFWATRMGLSKVCVAKYRAAAVAGNGFMGCNGQDNFWTSYGRDVLAPLGYNPDTWYNGRDAELHAVVSVLTGVVGVGA